MTRREIMAAGAAAGLMSQIGQGAEARFSPVLELRQYTLFGGKRDTFIDLFDSTFVESQEATGIKVIGQFRDLDDPDRFVWMRGFPSMEARLRSMNEFYFGPVWKDHRDAANACIVDSDNVLLLQPGSEGGLTLPASRDHLPPGGLIAISIHYLETTEPPAFAAFFESVMRPRLTQSGADIIATVSTNPAENNFPRLPVRTGERVFAWIGRFHDNEHHAAFARTWEAEAGWRDGAPVEVLPALMRKPEMLRLAPTERSLLR